VVRRVLKEYTEKGPTQRNWRRPKECHRRLPAAHRQQPQNREYLTVIGFYGLPLTYLDDFIPRIEAVTAEQIRDAFRRRVHPEHMLTVVVGGGGGY